MEIGIDIRPLMDREYSGVSWYTLDLICAILRQDAVNDFFLFYNSGHDISNRMPKFQQGNVRVVATKYPNKLFNYLFQNILHWPKLDRIASFVNGTGQKAKRADIYWLPHINFASFSKDCRKILTIHDLSFLVFPEFFSERKNVWHRMLNVKKQILSADKIIAISKNTKNDIIKFYGVPEDKISVVYSGVGGEFTVLDKKDGKLEEIRIKYALPERFILNIGTIEPRKNIVGLVKAFDLAVQSGKLSDCHLVIVGSKGWKNKEIYEAISLAKNRDKIKVIGYINKSERVYFYNLAEIFCYPSFYEGFGLPVLEAMASGVPVITSAVSSLPEVAGNAALYIDPNDISTIAVAMGQLAANNELKSLMIKNGLVQAKKFNWDTTAAEYLKIFKQYEKK